MFMSNYLVLCSLFVHFDLYIVRLYPWAIVFELLLDTNNYQFVINFCLQNTEW